MVARSASNHVFGGYSDVVWDPTTQPVGWKRSEAAFLFAIRAAAAAEPIKLPIIGASSEQAVCIYGMPAFGVGHDLEICVDANVKKESYCYLNSTFASPRRDGSGDDEEDVDTTFFTGEQYFLLADWEVFEVVAF